MEHDVIKYSMYPAGASGSGSEQMQSPCALLTHCWPSVYLEILFFLSWARRNDIVYFSYLSKEGLNFLSQMAIHICTDCCLDRYWSLGSHRVLVFVSMAIFNHTAV